MRTPTMRWRIPPLAWCVIGLAIAAESLSNALRAYGLGQHLEKFTVAIQGVSVSLSGAVLVLAAVVVSISQARAAWVALTPGVTRQRIVAGFAAALLLSVSVSAMALHILDANRVKVSTEGDARGSYDRAKAEYDGKAAELKALGSPRPVSVIQAEVQSTKIDMGVWRRSKECSDISIPETRELCSPILKLYQERGNAARKLELEPEVSRLREKLDRLNRPEEASSSESWVASLWAWIMGFAVVAVATFGSVIFARVEVVVPRVANDVGTLPPIPEDEPPGVDDDVIDWVREFRRVKGRSPQIPELQAAFPGTPKTTAWRRCRVA